MTRNVFSGVLTLTLVRLEPVSKATTLTIH